MEFLYLISHCKISILECDNLFYCGMIVQYSDDLSYNPKLREGGGVGAKKDQYLCVQNVQIVLSGAPWYIHPV